MTDEERALFERLLRALGWSMQWIPPRVQKHPVYGQLYRHCQRAHMDAALVLWPDEE